MPHMKGIKMLINEFIERTGFTPTHDEYAKIEEQYLSSDMQKDDFCMSWLENDGINRLSLERIRVIEQLNRNIERLDKKHAEERKEYNDRITELNQKLEKEMSWVDVFDIGTLYNQKRYLELCEIGRKLSDEKAKAYLYNEFGFAKEKILLIKETEVFEKNKYRQLRVKERFTREPVYCSTDYNYIRFNSGNWQFEVCDGELNIYFN